MGYLDSSDAELIALTRQRRSEAHAARIARLPQPMRYSALDPRFAWKEPEPPPRQVYRPKYQRPPHCSHPLIPESVFQTFWRLQDGRCYLCLKPFVPTDWATRDHVIPRSLGGDDAGNILLACGPCNNEKGDRGPHGCEMVYLGAVNAAFAGAWEPIWT